MDPTRPPTVPRTHTGGIPATVPVTTLLNWGVEQLRLAGAAPQEAQWLLEWSMGVDSLLRAEPQVGIRAAERYRSAVAQRRRGTPLQHVTGQMAFRHLNLKAGPGVFVVRPETERLVDFALEELEPGPARVADLCSGSGAIGLALATERPDTSVFAVEIDPQALRYLKANCARIEPLLARSTVSVRQEDAVSCLAGQDGTFDLVLSNPPYVGAADAPTQQEAMFDPALALYGGGEDGLVTPRGVVTRAFDLLGEGGTLLMEHGERQGRPLRDHAESVGFVECSTRLDLAGRPRYLHARKG